MFSDPESTLVRQLVSFTPSHVIAKHMAHVCFLTAFKLLLVVTPITHEGMLELVLHDASLPHVVL